MSWKNDISRELSHARKAWKEGNDGKARTCARRAVGRAAAELQERDASYALGRDFISQLRTIAESRRFPKDVRDAAGRLQARISTDFTSPSTDPIGDAETILSDLSSRLEQDQSRSSER